MKKTNKNLTKDICRGAVIAAAYAVLTLISNTVGLAGGAVQLRISEALCVLGVLTPAAVPGIAVGCLIANLLTGCAVWDIVIGSFASLVGMIGVRALRKHGRIAPLPYVMANTVLIPPVLRFVYGAEEGIVFLAVSIFIGEVLSAWLGGSVLLAALKKAKIEIK